MFIVKHKFDVKIEEYFRHLKDRNRFLNCLQF